MQCFAIRLSSWAKICESSVYFSECMKINFMYNYSQHVRRTLSKKKYEDAQKLMTRSDYHQILILKDFSQTEINNLKIQAFRKVESVKTNDYESMLLMRVINDKISNYQEIVQRMLQNQQEVLEMAIREKYKEIDPDFKFDVNLAYFNR